MLMLSCNNLVLQVISLYYTIVLIKCFKWTEKINGLKDYILSYFKVVYLN